MFDQSQIDPVKELVKEAKSVAILLPPEPSADAVGAGLGLHLAFQNAGKFSQIGCSSEIKVENADLFGVDQIRNTIGNQNLLISFEFKEENLKKVDYDVDENGKFTLLIQPQPGTPPPDANSVNFSYSGCSADVVFVLGINSLEELGKIYADEKQFLDQAQTVSLSLGFRPVSAAKHNFNSAEATSLAEITAVLLKELEVEPSNDAASNLLSTIYSESKQFTGNKVNADTFEMVAYLMRHGGNLPNSSPFGTTSRFGAFPPAAPGFGGGSPFGSPFGGGNPFGSPMTPPTFEDDLPPLPPTPAAIPSSTPARIPNDWKKPGRVFRSGGNPNRFNNNNRQGNRNNNNGPRNNGGHGQGMAPGGSL